MGDLDVFLPDHGGCKGSPANWAQDDPNVRVFEPPATDNSARERAGLWRRLLAGLGIGRRI